MTIREEILKAWSKRGHKKDFTTLDKATIAEQIFNRRLKELTDENESLKNAIRTVDRLSYGIAWDTEKSERQIHEEKIKELECRLKEIAEKALTYGYHVAKDEAKGIQSHGYGTRFLSSHGLLTEEKI
jgi:chromosome segregation ATPase